MYSIIDDGQILKLVISRKYERITGVLLMLMSLSMGSWNIPYQLRCPYKEVSYSGVCTLESKFLNIIPVSYRLGIVVKADVKIRTMGARKRVEQYQIFLNLNLGRIYFLQLFPLSDDDAMRIVSNINHYLSFETNITYNILSPTPSIYSFLAKLFTKVIFILGFFAIFLKNDQVSL